MKLIKLALSGAFLLLSTVFAHSQVSRAATQDSINTSLPSNSLRQITALKMQDAFRFVLTYVEPANIIANMAARAIPVTKLSQSGATTGQLLSWNGTNWAATTLSSSVAWGGISGTLSSQTDLQTALNAKQNLDSDLTTFAGLTPTTDNFLIAASSAWASRTPAQARTSLGATTIGSNLFLLTNPSAITFPRFNADNTVSALDAATYRTAIGAAIGTNVQAYDADLDDLADGTLTASKLGTGLNAANIADGTVSSAEFQYVGNVTSDLQTQLNAKQPNVQFKDEASNVSTSGGITSVNFTGPSVAATNSGAALTVDVKDYESLVIAASDRTTAITASTDKEAIPMPFAMTVTEVRAYLGTAQSSGSIFTVDIMENGVSILSTKITIDNTENHSKDAVTLPVISDTVLAKNSVIRIDVTQIGNGTAKDLKVTIDGYRN